LRRSSVERRLAAILAADVVGFSLLVGEDEEATLVELAAQRTIIDGLIRQQRGRVFGSAGDSVIAEFQSPVEAVRTAVDIQLALHQRAQKERQSGPVDGGTNAGRDMRWRIGVNLGDVVAEGDDLLGDGVNIAARLEAMAAPGGVCLSSTVVDHVCDHLELDLDDLGEQRLKNIARPVRAFRVPLASEVQEVAPYRGLEAFDASHARVFCGRARQVAATLERLQQQAADGHAFLLIYGASGVGKSSLMRAGLLPALTRSGTVEGLEQWRSVVFRPSAGATPIEALAAALLESGALPELDSAGLTPPALAAQLAEIEAGLPVSVQGVASRVPPLAMGVDQLEELLTVEGLGDAERSAFIRVLGQLAASGRVWIAATMRSDFFHRCAEVPGLSELKDGFGSYELLPPSAADIGVMIREPARRAGLRFEATAEDGRLDDVIQQAAARDPTALPLLSFTLAALWQTGKEQRLMTFADYRALGGLEGAIAGRADEVVTSLSEPVQAALPAVLRALTSVGLRDRTPTARAVPEAEVATTPERCALLDALAGARLLVRDEGAGGVATLHLAHEALLSLWPRAREIVSANQAFLATRTRLQVDLHRWLTESRNPELLLPAGRRLAEAEEVVAERANELGGQLIAYVRASGDAARRATRRRLHRTQAFAACMTVLAIIAAIGGYFGYAGQQRAEHQAEAARAAEVRAKTEAERARSAEAETTRQAAEVARQADLVSASRNEALRNQSLYLTDLSQQQVAAGDTTAGILLALEALPHEMAAPDRPYMVEAEAALYGAVVAHREVAVLRGHGGPVSDGAFSPDGSRMVTVSFDKTARLWDMPAGVEVAVLSDHRQQITDVAFSRDGAYVATASTDGTARVWNASTGEEIAALNGHGGAVTSVAFSPDGREVLTASKDKTARLWDARSEAELAVFEGHERALSTALFAPDGRRVITASADRSARIWDLATGELIAVLEGHERDVRAAAVDPDGVWVATGSADRTARLWDLATGRLASVLSGHKGRVDAIAFSRDGTRVVTGAADSTARLWNIAGYLIATLQGHEGAVTDVEFSQDGALLATASQDGTVRLWNGVTGAAIAVLRAHTAAVTSVAMSRDGSYALSTSNDRTARLWRALPEIGTISLSHPGPLGVWIQGDPLFGYYAAFDREGAKIVSTSRSKTAYLWDGRGRGTPVALAKHADWISHAAFSHNGHIVVTTSADSTARLWRSTDGEEIAVLRGHYGPVWYAAFDPSDRLVVTVSTDTTARLWDASTGRLRAILKGHELPVVRAAFSPDGRLVATASKDWTVRLWQADDGKLLRTLGGHKGGVYDVTFSPDGRHILTASSDQTARVWNVRTGALIHSLLGHSDNYGVWSAKYSRDGRLIVTTSTDSTRVWDASSFAQILVLDGGGYAEFSPNGKRIVTAEMGTTKLWDVATGGEIATLGHHVGWVGSAVFDPTGRRVVAAADDGDIRVFEVFPTAQELIDHARKIVPRQLTQCERERFFLSVEDDPGSCPK
jgi:WD40 repeat protein/class 3 adenylate cyclase